METSAGIIPCTPFFSRSLAVSLCSAIALQYADAPVPKKDLPSTPARRGWSPVCVFKELAEDDAKGCAVEMPSGRALGRPNEPAALPCPALPCPALQTPSVDLIVTMFHDPAMNPSLNEGHTLDPSCKHPTLSFSPHLRFLHPFKA
jgi:hypothetical protein